ncbi:MAG: WecB/TagA/CpsF family glycosyltransferase [Candidatus Daviesbacteria bacterium]|nr:WecB/TagA/CpsF family glycosyltransferase [Candidatus Daviesbacteria bacterium]
MSERLTHNGVPFDNIPSDERISVINNFLKATKPNQVVTLNPNMYLEALDQESFLRVLEEAALVIPESTGLHIYSLIKPPQMSRFPGVNVTKMAIEISADQDKSVLLIGSTTENRVEAVRNLQARHSKLQINQIPGEYNFANTTDSEWLINEIDKFNPNFLIMAGIQIQAETWINHWLVGSQVNVGLVGNFGQTIDLLAGKRADHSLARKVGLEWFCRFFTEPEGKANSHASSLWRFAQFVSRDAGANFSSEEKQGS